MKLVNLAHLFKLGLHLVLSGVASWYGIGDGTQGHLTASGVPFNTYRRMCASRTIRPFGRWVLIFNPRNGRRAWCQIMDNGPAAWTGRVIDLSYVVARNLGISGTGKVVVLATR